MAEEPNTPEEPAPPTVDPLEPVEEVTAEPAGSRWSRFKQWYRSHKKKSIPLTILALIALLLLLPPTRYPLAGAVYKKDFKVTVLDSVTNTPVSGATVFVGDSGVDTDGAGQATLHLPVGHKNLIVKKNYYENQRTDILVPILGKAESTVTVKATGRQVSVAVTNTFTHKPLADAEVVFADTVAKTDAEGKTVGVVPQATKSEKVTIRLEGYNDKQVTVQASDTEIKQNNFTLTPTGKIYFLSKLSGKIDVIKTNLDGTDRKTVLAGTGQEQESNTVLLASRDWKYLALLSRRDSKDAKLYLIETDEDRLTTIDEGDTIFTPIGWDDSHFLYQINRNNIPEWKANRSSIKSFDAGSKRITLLDNTAGKGTNQDNYAHESYSYNGAGFYLIDHNLIYIKSWDWTGSSSLISGKSNSIHKINVSGAGHRVLQTYPVDQYLNSFLYQPRVVYYQLQSNTPKYYVYANGVLSQNDGIKTNYQKYENTYVTNTYLQSPSGDQTFWFEERDGKNTLLLGDIDAGKDKPAGRTTDYNPYGWYTDDYLLVSKDSSELYVIPKEGLSDKIKAFKISDYHKPVRTFYGYGGGYGGL